MKPLERHSNHNRRKEQDHSAGAARDRKATTGREARGRPAASRSAFYDRLWIRAAVAAGTVEAIKRHDAYSDVFHQPGRSLACQARAAAMLVGLHRAGRLDEVDDPGQWAATLGLQEDARPVAAATPAKVDDRGPAKPTADRPPVGAERPPLQGRQHDGRGAAARPVSAMIALERTRGIPRPARQR